MEALVTTIQTVHQPSRIRGTSQPYHSHTTIHDSDGLTSPSNPYHAHGLGCRTEERRRVTRSFIRYNQRYERVWSDEIRVVRFIPTIPNRRKTHGSAARAAPRSRPGGPPPATAHPARVDATGRLCTTHRPQSLVLVVLLLLGVFPVVVAAIEWVRQRQAARRKVLHVLRDGALIAGLALYHG